MIANGSSSTIALADERGATSSSTIANQYTAYTVKNGNTFVNTGQSQMVFEQIVNSRSIAMRFFLSVFIEID